MKMIISNLLSYSVIELINKSIPFILLPILTAFLSIEEYGQLTLYQIILGGGAIIFSLGMTSIISVDFNKNSKCVRAGQLADIIKLCVFSFIISLPVIFIVAIYNSNYYLLIILFGSLGTAISNYFLAYMQVSRNIKFYALLSLSLSLLSFTFTLILIIYFNMGYEGRLYALSIPPVLIAFLFSWYYFYTNKQCMGESNITFKRVIPLFFHQISNWSRYSIDKLVLFFFLGGTALGTYNVNFQMAFILSVLVMVINKTFQPYVLKGLSQVKSTSHLLYGQLFLVAIGTLFIMFLILLFGNSLLGEGFKIDTTIIIILCIAFLFQGCYLCFCNYLYFYEKGAELAKNSTFCFFFTAVSSVPLVTYFGGMGAALSILVSMLILLLGTYRNYKRLKLS